MSKKYEIPLLLSASEIIFKKSLNGYCAKRVLSSVTSNLLSIDTELAPKLHCTEGKYYAVPTSCISRAQLTIYMYVYIQGLAEVTPT